MASIPPYDYEHPLSFCLQNMLTFRKKKSYLENDTEGIQDDIQELMLSITTRLDMVKSVEQVLGAGLTEDAMVKKQLQ